ncbi:MCE family protein, partial [Kibdelosporangium lantanae]
RLGDQTRAGIGIKTLLGEKYLALEPAGTGAQDPNVTIPRTRTSSPYDVTTALNQLTTTVNDIDTQQLAASFQVVADTFKNTPQHMKPALDGLSALSRTISSRDTELAHLLSNTSEVSKTLASRDDQIVKLIDDGNLLLAEIQKRKDAINGLLKGTQDLAAQLRGLVADNRTQLQPVLQQLDKVTSLLQRNQDNLSRGLAALAPFVRISTNTTGRSATWSRSAAGTRSPRMSTNLLMAPVAPEPLKITTVSSSPPTASRITRRASSRKALVRAAVAVESLWVLPYQGRTWSRTKSSTNPTARPEAV